MKERPILFSAPMVRAILEGRKTQTRRIVKLPSAQYEFCALNGVGQAVFTADERSYLAKNCPYGDPGDRLWVRESWYPAFKRTDTNSGAIYKVDFGHRLDLDPSYKPVDGWKNAMFMPRWASRITLEITDVRVQRLEEISYEDAKAEGCNPPEVRQFSLYGADAVGRKRVYDTHAELGFRPLWESINGAGSWNANPWVWAITFQRVDSAACDAERAA